MRRTMLRSRSFILCLLLLLLFSLWYLFQRKYLLEMEESDIEYAFHTKATKENNLPASNSQLNKKLTNMKYILLWTSPYNVPFVYLEKGQNRFIKNRCRHTNCYVTSDRSHFDDYTQFDVIIFYGPEIINAEAGLPSKRSEDQKYVFASIESSHTYPMCSNKFDGYFNWTWTYRLDSDSRWGYIAIRDINNNIIGPNKVMHWMKVEDMKPLSKEFQESLWTKTRAAAWFVSNCESTSRREAFAISLQLELGIYGLSIDTYGDCGELLCPKEDEQWCNEKIKTTYYFYLAFENSFSEDYVTEKLMLGLRNNAIPVVYGGANYTRFMPEGTYLDARELGPKRLAERMNELIRNPTKYASYFKWKNHYKYYPKEKSVETDDYCSMCGLLNDKTMMGRKTVYKNFRQWWDPPNVC